MNLRALCKNISVAIRTTPTLSDARKRIAWLYDDRIPTRFQKKERVISFKYPEPIGRIDLDLRSNKGADAFILSEVFEHQYYNVPVQIPPRTILDLGANVGMTAIYFARVFSGADIVCVEPIPANLKLLHSNLRRNGISAKVYEAAADSSDGHIAMDLNQLDYGFKVSSDGFEVPAISVETIMSDMGWARIGLLKIDIEGHEQVVLRRNCDWLHKVDAICIEIHDEYNESDLSDLSERYGFNQPEKIPGNWFLVRPVPPLKASTEADVVVR